MVYVLRDDIVLIDESHSGVNERMEVWRQALESKGFELSMTKTEYLECKFSGVSGEADGVEMKITEMRLLRWMCRHTKLDKIRNEDIREKVGVAPVDDKMREARLR
uniref:Reverse transcriptase domain-containing protein n=2 Tax=Nicotiana TaxID=4085 RepID=A0A1S4DFL4_TOBAC|nr:PREDICTED: uncharacterized protein LOC104234620 [Nicotiana sylvestris]XP_016512247.1 PREDICTED: uncharacterized protein LOC107829252 [Nicotiana tabacum]